MPAVSYERPIVAEILRGFNRPKKLIHIMSGPRQVGKTTAAGQIAARWPGKVVTASADRPLPPGPEWVRAHWHQAELQVEEARGNARGGEVLLILDEIQKVRGWSEVVKELWDERCARDLSLQVLLLGSSSLLLHKGMTESLSGRFFLYRTPHWDFREVREAFGLRLEEWIYFGGYPGAIDLIGDEDDWARYVTDSLIETVIAKDVLQLQTINKPALLRHLFLLACGAPAQIVSYNKMMGQLQDAGNTTTLANYLRILESAFLLSGLERYKHGHLKRRGSSPKLVIWNNALVNAVAGMSFSTARRDFSWWGRLVENAVGARFLNNLSSLPYRVYYWRERGLEVDFVVETPRRLWAVEVKSGKPERSRGLEKFCALYPQAMPLLIGKGIAWG